MLKLQMTSGHVRAGHLQPQYGFQKLRSNMVANNSNTLQKCFTQDELTHWTVDTHKINSLKPNVILLQTVPFKRALSITSKLTNNLNITRYSITALCFLNGGQHIRNVRVTGDGKGDKAGDIQMAASRHKELIKSSTLKTPRSRLKNRGNVK